LEECVIRYWRQTNRSRHFIALLAAFCIVAVAAFSIAFTAAPAEPNQPQMQDAIASPNYHLHPYRAPS